MRVFRKTLLLSFIVIGFAQFSTGEPPVTRKAWPFSNSDEVNLLYYVNQAPAPYDVSIVSKTDSRWSLTITISEGKRDCYFWVGNEYTPFQILDRKLYLAKFSPGDTGGTVEAVDLDSGKVLWKSELQALGEIEHSVYSNRITLGFDADGHLAIYGNESRGRYVEIKDISTGQTISHKKM